MCLFIWSKIESKWTFCFYSFVRTHCSYKHNIYTSSCKLERRFVFWNLFDCWNLIFVLSFLFVLIEKKQYVQETIELTTTATFNHIDEYFIIIGDSEGVLTGKLMIFLRLVNWKKKKKPKTVRDRKNGKLLCTLNEPGMNSVNYIERIGNWVLAGKTDGTMSFFDLNNSVWRERKKRRKKRRKLIFYCFLK